MRLSGTDGGTVSDMQLQAKDSAYGSSFLILSLIEALQSMIKKSYIRKEAAVGMVDEACQQLRYCLSRHAPSLPDISVYGNLRLYRRHRHVWLFYVYNCVYKCTDKRHKAQFNDRTPLSIVNFHLSSTNLKNLLPESVYEHYEAAKLMLFQNVGDSVVECTNEDTSKTDAAEALSATNKSMLTTLSDSAFAPSSVKVTYSSPYATSLVPLCKEAAASLAVDISSVFATDDSKYQGILYLHSLGYAKVNSIDKQLWGTKRGVSIKGTGKRHSHSSRQESSMKQLKV